MALYYPTNPRPAISFSEDLQFLTSISRFANGVEQRQSRWGQPKKLFTMKYAPMDRPDFDRLWNFYQLCKGSYKAFNFQDPEDALTGPLLPYDQVKVWVPLHEGEGTKLDDRNGYLFPTYSCRFVEDRMSKEHFTDTIFGTGLQVVQESPLSFTNNYGTLAGTYTWLQVYDGTVCPSFDGVSGYCTFGDAADLDVGVGDFSFAIGVYPSALADDKPIITKKADNLAGTDGWALLLNGDGSIDAYFADGATLKTISSAAGALVATTWKIIVVTMDRDGNGQIYVNNVASGAAVDISAASANADSATAAYIARQGAVYGNVATRNFLFAKKTWTQAERDLIWGTWRGIFGL